MAIEPGNPEYELTEALLLVEEGEGSRAEEVLRKLAQSRLDAGSRGAAAIYLARVLHERKAPAAEIARWRKCARAWSTDTFILQRVEALLPEPS